MGTVVTRVSKWLEVVLLQKHLKRRVRRSVIAGRNLPTRADLSVAIGNARAGQPADGIPAHYQDV